MAPVESAAGGARYEEVLVLRRREYKAQREVASLSVVEAGAIFRRDIWGQEIDEEVLCQDILLRAWSPNHTASRKGRGGFLRIKRLGTAIEAAHCACE